ncbi:hypothetical protein [Pseudovibrio sp. Tun.PSC04-5.I4]|uniref:hypothetical protein n=1 Tax=Pseudovibrio sp. Tun.PSC04-5.I4 TaxID=1798213 RepID=UPI00190EF69B|nr:hypothetical protein [Pseudovibrio sp. Tun.PSC04-5.I4]
MAIGDITHATNLKMAAKFAWERAFASARGCYQLNLEFLAKAAFRHISGVDHGGLLPLGKCVKTLRADVACAALMVGCDKEIAQA